MSLLLEIARCKHVENCLHNCENENKYSRIVRYQKNDFCAFGKISG